MVWPPAFFFLPVSTPLSPDSLLSLALFCALLQLPFIHSPVSIFLLCSQSCTPGQRSSPPRRPPEYTSERATAWWATSGGC